MRLLGAALVQSVPEQGTDTTTVAAGLDGPLGAGAGVTFVGGADTGSGVGAWSFCVTFISEIPFAKAGDSSIFQL